MRPDGECGISSTRELAARWYIASTEGAMTRHYQTQLLEVLRAFPLAQAWPPSTDERGCRSQLGA